MSGVGEGAGRRKGIQLEGKHIQDAYEDPENYCYGKELRIGD
jgi:hypothetical protein